MSTIHPNDCGNCIHWHEWDESQQKYAPLLLGNCDKLSKGQMMQYENGTFTYDGYSFEDECYDECFHCFEGKENK